MRIEQITRRIIFSMVLIGLVAVGLSGCIVVPGYAGPGPGYAGPGYAGPPPGYVAPRPVYVAPPSIYFGGGYYGGGWYGGRRYWR